VQGKRKYHLTHGIVLITMEIASPPFVSILRGIDCAVLVAAASLAVMAAESARAFL
jgi:hypothetical protein